MVYVIKDTVDIYCFCKNWYKTAQEHPVFKLPPISLNQIEKFLHFSFKTVWNFSNSNPDPPGQRKLGENPTPGQWERVNPRGSPGGDGQAWNWLIHITLGDITNAIWHDVLITGTYWALNGHYRIHTVKIWRTDIIHILWRPHTP